MGGTLVYAFCITRRPPAPDVTSRYPFLDHVEVDGFFVAVRSVSSEEYSDEKKKLNLADQAWLELHAREHLGVITAMMEQQPVIPLNFGTLFNSRSSLADFIGNHAAALDAALLGIGDKEEWSVKSYCKESLLLEGLGSVSPLIADFDRQIAESSPGRAYILKKKREELIGKELDSACAVFAEKIFGRLVPFSVEHRLHQLVPTELSPGGDRMILNASFLVLKKHVEEFIRISGESGTAGSASGVFSDVTGPWPPYNFIAIGSKP